MITEEVPAKKSVLIVEDDLDLRHNLKDLLLDEGYAVIVARNGREALSALLTQTVRPDLILLDLMMPIMDGRTFVNALKNAPSTALASIPVVVLTAAGHHARKELDGLEVVQKPVNLDVLLEIVARRLNSANR